MKELLLILLLLGFIWFWRENMRLRERAQVLAKQACIQAGVQFLDQSVSFSGFSIGRNHKGAVALSRRYAFEFSADGTQRQGGLIRFNGERVEELVLDMHNTL